MGTYAYCVVPMWIEEQDHIGELSIDDVMSMISHVARIEDIKISSTPIEDIIKEIYTAQG